MDMVSKGIIDKGKTSTKPRARCLGKLSWLGNKHVREVMLHGGKKADSGIILLHVNPGADLGQVPY